MIHNSWKARLLFGLAIWVANIVHHEIVADCANTPEAMFLYHFSAAAVDCMLLVSAASCLKGRLCDDLETLCLVSIVVNGLGFLAYMAYAPPITYNYAIGVLGYVQYARLLMVARYDFDRMGNSFLRGLNFGRS
jgi:hypothetical protein